MIQISLIYHFYSSHKKLWENKERTMQHRRSCCTHMNIKDFCCLSKNCLPHVYKVFKKRGTCLLDTFTYNASTIITKPRLAPTCTLDCGSTQAPVTTPTEPITQPYLLLITATTTLIL